jgi:outer membrane autotransporter protein
VGGAAIDADSSTHSDQYDAKVMFGRDYDVDYGTIITPDVSMAYTYLNTQGYTETGSASNLTVASNSQSNLDLGIGAKIAWKLKNPDGSLMKPALHAGYSYAAVDSRIDTTASFTGAIPANDPTFVTEGPTPERSRFDVGAGITYMTTANWDLTANYNYEYRTDYTSNTGTLRATAHF